MPTPFQPSVENVTLPPSANAIALTCRVWDVPVKFLTTVVSTETFTSGMLWITAFGAPSDKTNRDPRLVVDKPKTLPTPALSGAIGQNAPPCSSAGNAMNMYVSPSNATVPTSRASGSAQSQLQLTLRSSAWVYALLSLKATPPRNGDKIVALTEESGTMVFANTSNERLPAPSVMNVFVHPEAVHEGMPPSAPPFSPQTNNIPLASETNVSSPGGHDPVPNAGQNIAFSNGTASYAMTLGLPPACEPAVSCTGCESRSSQSLWNNA
mmetsp:Transcript_104307/g.301765  ORF Transcript_104307/g.301765 Transcript_104307/m.301765 type:complete len:267 (-) Transcript_104307:393-1193(-)